MCVCVSVRARACACILVCVCACVYAQSFFIKFSKYKQALITFSVSIKQSSPLKGHYCYVIVANYDVVMALFWHNHIIIMVLV